MRVGRTSLRWFATAATSIPLLASLANAEQLVVEDGILQAINAAGIAEGTIDFSSSSSSASKILGLTSESTLKLTYSLPSSIALSSISYSAVIFSTLSPSVLSSSLAAPSDTTSDEQALALFRRANSQFSSVSIPLTPKKGGKFRWEWDLANPSSNSNRKEEILTLARKTDGRVKAQVLVAASEPSTEPVLVDVGTVVIKDETYWKTEAGSQRKWPREWEMERYSARKELSWTFGQKRAGIGAAKTFIGTAIVLAPWTILALFVPTLLSSSFHFAPSGLSSLFLVSLLSLDIIILSYWFSAINAWQFMPSFAGAGLLSALIGKSALSERNAARSTREVRKKFEAGGAASDNSKAE